MTSLLIPSKVVLRLVDSARKPLRVAKVLFVVRTFANRKSDFTLGPFATDAGGVATIRPSKLVRTLGKNSYEESPSDGQVLKTLRDLYRAAANKRISAQSVKVRWDGSENEYEYAVAAVLR